MSTSSGDAECTTWAAPFLYWVSEWGRILGKARGSSRQAGVSSPDLSSLPRHPPPLALTFVCASPLCSGRHDLAHMPLLIVLGNPWISGALGAFALLKPGRQ